MLGQDLAAIYETEPRLIARAVARNQERFPDDFVFRLTDAETAILKSQIGTSNLSEKANRDNPLGFTKTGANMLSLVLKSPVAIQRSVEILRAFTAMEHLAATDRLRKARQAERRAQVEWQSARSEGKVVRRQETDVIQEFVQYACEQGSVNSNRYYMSITKMVKSVLGEQAKRDTLDAGELMTLAVAERVTAQALQEAMCAGLPYKVIYQSVKAKVTTLAALVQGISAVPMVGTSTAAGGR